MHAFLVISQDTDEVEVMARQIAKKHGDDVYDFSVTKIANVRELAGFVKLSFTKPTSIVISDIEKATEEALNAFLKNLEEPQKNLTYVLAASSEEKLIPTIVSRCQIVRLKLKKKNPQEKNKHMEGFLDLSLGQKFTLLGTVKKRDDALDFMADLITTWHALLIQPSSDSFKASRTLKLANETYNAIKANGNVSLQLTNFAIKTSF